jgi:2-keto-4-pentenoate hydratase/2-oxohepta-3-ene-1,7-dioic acid hydratase in catechol pathway
MIFGIPEIIAYLSSIFTLEAGDLLFTGTPEGVGPVHHGDTLEASLESVGTLTVRVE